MNIGAGPGVAVREFPLKTGFADYLLYADGRVIGVVEAKPEGHTLKGVELQSSKYLSGLPVGLPRWTPDGTALPFAYESTGTVTQFTSNLDPEPRSREVFAFHRPEELIRLAGLERQLRANLRQMPALDTSKLWEKQVAAIQNLEKSLANDHARSLIQMVMGAGKTFTACNIAYRLIKFGGAKRVLFLVDRNNLGKQTLNEFQQFASPYNQYKFTEEFGVQHLRKNAIDPAAKVVNESQIRLVLRTFKERLPEIFPGRTECPKTLVFAKTDLHADDVTRIIREEFGKGNDFCQKITSKSTGKKPEELLNEFRNSYMPRVAVTVDMIATGTDVNPPPTPSLREGAPGRATGGGGRQLVDLIALVNLRIFCRGCHCCTPTNCAKPTSRQERRETRRRA
ncbi:MAG: DEAD/DEAH box helicase family protein [Phycisphaeraceae bacterium]|nr:DEAD/DEAH box helicase family protein [Phycisphaeraceae bacterium]